MLIFPCHLKIIPNRWSFPSWTFFMTLILCLSIPLKNTIRKHHVLQVHCKIQRNSHSVFWRLILVVTWLVTLINVLGELHSGYNTMNKSAFFLTELLYLWKTNNVYHHLACYSLLPQCHGHSNAISINLIS
jgi:hypothetical protein